MLTIKTKKIPSIVYLIFGLILLAAGIFFIVSHTGYSLIALCIIYILYLLFETIYYIFGGEAEGNKKNIILAIVFFFIVSALIILFALLFYSIIAILFIILSFVLFLVRTFICVHLYIVDGPNFIKTALLALLCLAVGITLICLKEPYRSNLFFTIIGIYFMAHGISCLADFFNSITRAGLSATRTKRRIRFSTPNIFTFGLTKDIISECNKVLRKDDNITVLTCEKEGENIEDANFEILVHVSRIPGKQFGHVDICIDNTIYTYGCYETTSCRFGGLFADGIFMIVPKQPYIENCLKNQRKYIIGYGCKLSDFQMENVKARINEFLSETKPMEIDTTQEETRLGGDGVIATAKMGGHSHKVVNGPFKTYFAIATNCVALADTIIGKAGIDSLSSGSIKTPGAYFDMLDSLFNRSNTLVIKRTAYLQSKAGEIKEQGTL